MGKRRGDVARGVIKIYRPTSRSIIPGCGSRVSNAELFNINTTKKLIWFRLSCRANIIRIDRRNLLKLTNKHLWKHRPIISKFIHKFISFHYYSIVSFLYYQKCAKTHLQQCRPRNFKKFREDPWTTHFQFKKL